MGNRRVGGLYVVGGRQRKPRPLYAGDPWEGYDRALVLGVDLSSGTITPVLEYVSPDDAVSGPDAPISFQASSIEGDLFYTCTQTEVMVYSLPEFERLHYISLPCFNDVHHVRPTPGGNILVANAGLEMVLELEPSGEILEAWNVLGEDPWKRVDPGVDYRKVSTKPHRAHPNFVFYAGEEVWVTRFEQGDAISLTAPGRSIHVSDRRIHDGMVVDGRLYFTTVDGTIVVFDVETLEVQNVIELAELHEDRTLLGWCRSLLLDGDHLWVGFSRIRPTQFRENVAWVARGFRRGKPTHIACYDLANRTCVTEIDLEPSGLAAVYSILPAVSANGSG